MTPCLSLERKLAGGGHYPVTVVPPPCTQGRGERTFLDQKPNSQAEVTLESQIGHTKREREKRGGELGKEDRAAEKFI